MKQACSELKIYIADIASAARFSRPLSDAMASTRRFLVAEAGAHIVAKAFPWAAGVFHPQLGALILWVCQTYSPPLAEFFTSGLDARVEARLKPLRDRQHVDVTLRLLGLHSESPAVNCRQTAT